MIVLRGLGIDIDTNSSIVAFGLARDLVAGETVEQAVVNADVSQWFVLDFGMGRRKPTAAEIRRIKRLSALLAVGNLTFSETPSGRKGQINFNVSRARIPRMRKAA